MLELPYLFWISDQQERKYNSAKGQVSVYVWGGGGWGGVMMRLNNSSQPPGPFISTSWLEYACLLRMTKSSSEQLSYSKFIGAGFRWKCDGEG